MSQIKYNFGWGNPYFLLDILSNMYVGGSYPNVHSMIYGPYEGVPALIEETHKVIKQVTGMEYKYILITNGASNAINTVLRYFASRGGRNVFTTKYGYPSYEEMIRRAGLVRTRDLNAMLPDLGFMGERDMRLIDSPENPFGAQYGGGDANRDIWDSVYHSKIYTRNLMTIPKHKYHIGSYSKLLGVAGARVGFIAVNEPLLYDALVAESRNDLTGPSRPSQCFVLDILKKVNLDDFMIQGAQDLCYNKEEFTKLEYLFDGQKVNETGMFYCVKPDSAALKLLEKVGVEYVRLDDDTIRLSMGQTKDVVKQGIKAILKGDRK